MILYMVPVQQPWKPLASLVTKSRLKPTKPAVMRISMQKTIYDKLNLESKTEKIVHEISPRK